MRRRCAGPHVSFFLNNFVRNTCLYSVPCTDCTNKHVEDDLVSCIDCHAQRDSAVEKYYAVCFKCLTIKHPVNCDCLFLEELDKEFRLFLFLCFESKAFYRRLIHGKQLRRHLMRRNKNGHKFSMKKYEIVVIF